MFQENDTMTDLEEWSVGGRRVVMRALCGSACQGLSTPSSDLDWKGLFLPSADDLMESRIFKHTGSGDDDDYDDHDIRTFPDLLWKSNPSYLEILFPADARFSDDPSDAGVAKALKEWSDRREDVARMNLPYLWNASWGIMTAMRARAKDDHTPVGDKKAAHALRVCMMLDRYAENGFADYASCCRLPDDMRSVVMDVKTGVIDRAEADSLIDGWAVRAESHRREYLDAEPDRELFGRLKNGLYAAVWNRVRRDGYRGGRSPLADQGLSSSSRMERTNCSTYGTESLPY